MEKDTTLLNSPSERNSDTNSTSDIKSENISASDIKLDKMSSSELKPDTNNLSNSVSENHFNTKINSDKNNMSDTKSEKQNLSEISSDAITSSGLKSDTNNLSNLRSDEQYNSDIQSEEKNSSNSKSVELNVSYIQSDEKNSTDTKSDAYQVDGVPVPSFEEIIYETFFKPFKWDARSTRKTFWLGYLSINIIDFLYWLILLSDMGINFVTGQIGWLAFHAVTGLSIGIALSIYLLLCELGLTVRRLHDTNRNGAWFWIRFVPVIGWIWLLWLLCLPTVTKPVKWNKYLFKINKIEPKEN